MLAITVIYIYVFCNFTWRSPRIMHEDGCGFRIILIQSTHKIFVKLRLKERNCLGKVLAVIGSFQVHTTLSHSVLPTTLWSCCSHFTGEKLKLREVNSFAHGIRVVCGKAGLETRTSYSRIHLLINSMPFCLFKTNWNPKFLCQCTYSTRFGLGNFQSGCF